MTVAVDIILWITQLVVHTEHRKRGIATSMARMLKDHPSCAKATIAGIASSHPAACNTLANLAGKHKVVHNLPISPSMSP